MFTTVMKWYRVMTMNFSIGMMNGAASVEKQPDTTHWYMWKYPRMHCFGCIIIRRERKSGFLRMKAESRFGGNMEMFIVSILLPCQRLKVKGLYAV